MKDAEVVHNLKKWLSEKKAKIGVIAKIEAAESIDNVEDILDAVDGAMVARGDLGAELPFEQVPFWQSSIIQGCRYHFLLSHYCLTSSLLPLQYEFDNLIDPISINLSHVQVQKYKPQNANTVCGISIGEEESLLLWQQICWSQ